MSFIVKTCVVSLLRDVEVRWYRSLLLITRNSSINGCGYGLQLFVYWFKSFHGWVCVLLL
jgi:hypothetical protein